MRSFRAIEIQRGDDGYMVDVVDRHRAEPGDGEVLVDVAFSDLNYKDGLVMSGRFDLVTRFPMVAGIDLVGTVAESNSDNVRVGQLVTANGWGLGTDHDGGLAQATRLREEWVTPVPAGIDAFSAAAIGTAGYTAALAVCALRHRDVTKDSGPVLVTGAAGGAGSIAVLLLSRLGYTVVASTGRRDSEAPYLASLGASEVIDRITPLPSGQLGKAKWAGAVDTVGSSTLATILAETRYGGTVSAMGMAQGVDLPGSVVPFITRGVTLAGIDSVYAPHDARLEAWALLEDVLDLEVLAGITETIGLSGAPDRALEILAGKVRGRVVVDVNA
ncbi:acryloyl-CoA reductase [Nocardioides sp.]|uniref:acrylyl-CoA reductase family protein n=1 Tax=Nocardioides sp. TaxID=35761 RepID=UPI003D0F7F5A